MHRRGAVAGDAGDGSSARTPAWVARNWSLGDRLPSPHTSGPCVDGAMVGSVSGSCFGWWSGGPPHLRVAAAQLGEAGATMVGHPETAVVVGPPEDPRFRPPQRFAVPGLTRTWSWVTQEGRLLGLTERGGRPLCSSSVRVWRSTNTRYASRLRRSIVGGPSMSPATPEGAWAAVLLWSLLATFSLAASIPYRTPISPFSPSTTAYRKTTARRRSRRAARRVTPSGVRVSYPTKGRRSSGSGMAPLENTSRAHGGGRDGPGVFVVISGRSNTAVLRSFGTVSTLIMAACSPRTLLLTNLHSEGGEIARWPSQR